MESRALANTSRAFPPPRKSSAPGRPINRCRGIARSVRFSSVTIGSRRASGRIGMGSGRCWSARFWFRSSRWLFAVPLGVASAVYVSEIATREEKRFIKPYIEFISAIPSVVLGFFGIAVVGQAVRALSRAAVFQLGAVLSDQRAAEHFHCRLPARAHGGADDFHSRGRCAPQCAARIQGSFLRARREPPPDDRADPRSRLRSPGLSRPFCSGSAA